jgi:hypothetical protein
MPNSELASIIQQIHDAPQRLVLEFAGAGSVGLAWLHAVGGSSRTILEATDRYSQTSMVDLLGRVPDSFVSPATASAMAERAYQRAVQLASDDIPCLGVGLTATIATDRTKKGDHRIVVAVQDSLSCVSIDLQLAKGRRDRDGEEEIVARVLLRAIAAGCQLDAAIPLDVGDDEPITINQSPAEDAVAGLFAGSINQVTIHPDGTRTANEPAAGIIYSGSFNPLHFGHEALAAAASRVRGQPVTFELPVVNAEKSPLSRSEIERRLIAFRHRQTVVLTKAPLFRDKADLFPACTFLLGYDTAIRLVDPKFYGNSDTARDDALSHLATRGCHILVAGRVQDDAFKTLADVEVPAPFTNLFDISATSLRAKTL